MVMNPENKIIHPIWLRANHWINLLAVVIMVLSGWRIYNASPIFAFSFPKQITLGGWLGGALLWHFAAMWLLFFNGVMYLFLNILSGRFKVQILSATSAGSDQRLHRSLKRKIGA